MEFLEKKIPPLIVVLLLGLFMWGLSEKTYRIDSILDVPVVISIIFIILGIFFTFSGVIHFKVAKTTVNPINPSSASTLITTGIYKYSRNPMYLGFSFFLMAWGVFLLAPVNILFVVAYFLYMNKFQIIPEEKALLSLFGEEYRLYLDSVRRWL